MEDRTEGKRRLLSLSARYTVVALLAVVLVPVAFLLSSFTFAGENTEESDLKGVPEPSGVVYHAERKTLFVVGDEGEIGEVGLDGKLLRSAHIGGDLEGVTYDPSTGNLYVVREGHEIIFELRADDFSILRRFSIDRSFAGDPNFLRRGGDGVEGLTFVPSADNPEGGTFFAVNQYDPPVMVELLLTLRTSKEKYQTAKIVTAKEIAPAPLSDVAWDAALDGFLIPSAIWRKVYVTDHEGVYLGSVRVPAMMPEGIAPLPDGGFAIAQDTGGMVIWHPTVNPFVMKRPGEGQEQADAG